jgi:hypothetical protein
VVRVDGVAVGRVLNRLSKDTDQVDVMIPNILNGTWNVSVNIIANFIAISITIPWFLLAMFGIGILLLAVQHFYKR